MPPNASPSRIPVYSPTLGDRERELVLDCLDSGWISSRGEYVTRFESAVADYCRIDHAVAVANGTLALHLAMLILDIGPGDEVIVPDLTYVATGNCVKYVGATPVVVDVDPVDWNISVDGVASAISDRTRAVIAVDLYGAPADYEGLREVIAGRGTALVADAAESLGSTTAGVPTPALADVSILSFFGNKTVTTGEGGMLLTPDAEMAHAARQLATQNQSESRRYFHDGLGFNFRMTNVTAAIGVAQMERIDAILVEKRRVFDAYRAALGNRVTFQSVHDGRESNRWLVSGTVDDPVALAEALDRDGIETRPVFAPLSAMPHFDVEPQPVSAEIARRGLSLPSHPGLTDTDVAYIAERVDAALGGS